MVRLQAPPCHGRYLGTDIGVSLFALLLVLVSLPNFLRF